MCWVDHDAKTALSTPRVIHNLGTGGSGKRRDVTPSPYYYDSTTSPLNCVEGGSPLVLPGKIRNGHAEVGVAIAREICNRLKFSNEDKEQVQRGVFSLALVWMASNRRNEQQEQAA